MKLDQTPRGHDAQQHPTVARHGIGPKLSFRKKIVFSLVATCLALGMTECLLAVFWKAPPPADPYVGFSASVPLLITEERDNENGQLTPAVIRINPAKLVWFNDQSFSANKPPGTYRIVCLGGSTTYGRPFDDSTSFCGWLRTLLPLVEPNRNWEVINAGGISYASYRVARVMEEFSNHDVDLFLLYTGHNEFLEWRTYGDLMESTELPRAIATMTSRTHLGQAIQMLMDRARAAGKTTSKQTLPGEVDEILNHSVGPATYQRDDQWHRGVEEHFRINLQRMEQIADEAGAKLAVIVPATNLRDCAPFKSEFGDLIADETRRQLNEDLQTARLLLGQGNAAAGLEVLELILETDQENADVHYFRGRALFDLGRFDLAAASFQRAVDEDICCLRATTAIQKIIRTFALHRGVINVDFESHLQSQMREREGHVCFGAESFLDHVHPTILGHREIALLTLKALADQSIISAPPSTPQIDAATKTIEQGIDLRAQGIAFRNLAKLTHWAGKFDEAMRHANDALRLLPLDLESRFLLADCHYKAGELEAAAMQYERLFEIGDFDRAFQPYGELLAMNGQTEAAKAYLMQAIFVSTGDRQASAFESLGRIHESLGEQPLADECFQNAKKLREQI